jgi:3-oxoacyl-[acyl-carrier protein] reductase
LSQKKGRLENRVAIVTGASRGIGRAIAIIFAREGARVVVNYRRQEGKAEEVVKIIRKAGGRAFAFQADVANRTAVYRMVESTIKEFGGVDILVNNAGLGASDASLLELKDEDFDAMFNTNVKGVLICTQAVASHMIKNRYGKVVNISSVAGIGTSVLPGNLLYAGTKGAVNVMSKRMALELGAHGIYVNAIAPGLIRTDMAFGRLSPSERKRKIRSFNENSMLNRVGEAEDVASIALFLASDESNFITAQVISVDGGRMNFITHSS